MKKELLTLIVILAFLQSFSQKARLSVIGGYVFNESFDYYQDPNNFYNGRINGGFQWGASAEYIFHPLYSAELSYFRQSTEAPTTFKAGANIPGRIENFDLAINYIMLGANRYFPMNQGKIEGFGGIMLGLLTGNIEAPSNGAEASSSKFAWGAKLGSNFWVAPKVGIKLQATLLSAAQYAGGEYFFSYYGPVYIETYTSIFQFSLGGGLTFKLGK